MKCCGRMLKQTQLESELVEDLDDSEKISELKQDLLAKLRQRKKAVKERAEKKAKTVVVAGNREAPHDWEKVLHELGELDIGTTNAKDNSKKKRKKAKKNLKQNNKVEPDSLANKLEMPKDDFDYFWDNDVVVLDKDSVGKSEQEKNTKIPISNVDGQAQINLERSKDANWKNENIPLEVLEYWENIEHENQRHKETLGFMETLMKRCENLQIQNQNLEVQNETLQAHAKNLEAKSKIVEDSQVCKICMENEISFVFIPCGHLITCENCALSENLKNCPMCRKQITTHLKTYLS